MIKIIIILFSLFIHHPVHVSMSSLYQKDGSNEINLFIKINTNDLHYNLHKLYKAEGEYIDHDHTFIFKGGDSYYQRYFSDMLKISVDNILIDKVLLDKSVDDEQLIFNFRLKIDPKLSHSIKVENKILVDLFPDQVNLFIFNLFNNNQGVKFTKEKTEHSFIIKK